MHVDLAYLKALELLGAILISSWNVLGRSKLLTNLQVEILVVGQHSRELALREAIRRKEATDFSAGRSDTHRGI